ncbi:MAG: SEL1-like repeat protein [Legionella sp.]|jgi:enhanced entry protein EnhC
MKSLVPWVCLLVASASQQALAEDNFSAYRLGHYNKAADPLLNQTGKDAVADYYLGRMYLYGYGQLKNTNMAIRYFTKSAEKGYLPSMLVMAKYSLLQLKDPQQAIRWFKSAADAGDVSAQMFMAASYLYGIGVKQNYDIATKFYIDAAKNGNAIAQFTLAENFIDSRHSSNAKLGLIWLTKSAASGNPKALTRLAAVYGEGKLVPKDVSKAKELLNKALEQNFVPAMIAMGDLTLSEGDYQQAINWYNKGANVQNTQAYLHLAKAYLQDKSPIYDANAGFLWTLKAAQSGSIQAKNDLAQLYQKGIGVEANNELAKQWSDLAAQEAKKRNSTPSLAQAALWLSNDATDKLEQTPYQMGGIFSAWQNAAALQDNIYNQAPKIDGLTRKSIFKPQFDLTQPNEVSIASYYDALNTQPVTYEENQWTYPSYPLNRQIESLQRVYSMALNKLNLPAPYMDASYYDYDDYSQASLMDIWTEGWEKQANFNAVFNQLYFRAILGDAQSQFEIGQMFQYGLGVAQNDAAAIAFYQNAAQQQHLGAEYNLGIINLMHPQDANSYQSALNWLTDSAFKGNRKAQYVLARVLEQGKKGADGTEYIKPNHEQAVSMLYLAASNNYGPAQFDLAENLAKHNDSSLSVDVKKHRIALIRQLYQGAANNRVAQAILPLAFYNAMDQDKQKQAEAFIVAEGLAQAGDDKVALLLGLLYDRGIGVQANAEKAMYWYQHAGQNPVSDFILGTYTAEGKGVPTDKAKGTELLARSAQAKFSYGDFNLAVLKQQAGTEFLPFLISSYDLGNNHAGIVLADYYLSENNETDKINHAKQIFTGLAEKGDQYAQLKLGYMLDKGLGSNADPVAAERWYLASAEQGNPLAQYLLGQYYQVGTAGAPDYVLSKEWYQKAANQLSTASVALGFIYETVEDNYALALKAYEQAAAQGDTNGIYDLALMYLYGKGTAVDYPKAKTLLTEAANKGLSAAMTQLGLMSFKGLGQPRNDKEALAWYQKAAALGNAYASYEIGVFFETGLGTTVDYKEALKQYQVAADRGNQQALLALARMYQYGVGVDKDLKRSADIYQQLADKQNAYAQYQLGTFYLEGTAGERSPDKGKQWLRQASDNGNLQARKALQKLDSTPMS